MCQFLRPQLKFVSQNCHSPGTETKQISCLTHLSPYPLNVCNAIIAHDVQRVLTYILAKVLLHPRGETETRVSTTRTWGKKEQEQERDGEPLT